jgi:hypothetical protein
LGQAEATAHVARESDKKKSNTMKVNSSKSMKRGADRAKQKFPCNKCKQLGHWAAECPQKQQHAWDRGGKSAAKKNADAFLVHVMGVSSASTVDADSWYCDIGATRHITPNKHYFVPYKNLPIICLNHKQFHMFLADTESVSYHLPFIVLQSVT